MGVTLKDLFGHVQEKKSKLVVFRQITTFLDSQFLSADTHGPKVALQLDEGGEISEQIVEEVIDIIYRDHIAPLEKDIVYLLDTELDSKLAELRAEKEESRLATTDIPEEEPVPSLKKKAK